MKFALALLIAVHFWSDRNVHVPCHPVAVSGADALLAKDQWGNPDAMATTTGCRILISSQMPNLRASDPEFYCAYVVHEVGHLAGLPHTPTGIMSGAENGIEENGIEIPWACMYWKHAARSMGIKPHDARRVL